MTEQNGCSPDNGVSSPIPDDIIDVEPSISAVSMRDINVGWVIEDEYGRQLRVEKIIRNPQYDRDGVPCVVEVRNLKSGINSSISFGSISPKQRVADWRKWKVVSK